MEVRKEVIAAISAAVGLYIQSGQQMQVTAEPLVQAPQAPQVLPNVWGMSGRQTTMDMRRYLQLRMLR